MVKMTECEKYGKCVVLGCELLNEFRNNGSLDCIQQRMVNSDGFIWLSIADYRGIIKPDEVYLVGFFGIDENETFIPLFWVDQHPKIRYKFAHSDPFPNADPELRDAYMKDSWEPYSETPFLAYEHEVREYDGIRR